MDWLNIHSSTLDSPEMVGSDPIDRATWLFLQRFCIGQENGGRIANCNAWANRKWQQLARVTLKEVNRPCDLWAWDGPDLVVWRYPTDKEAEVISRRGVAKLNGTKGGRPKKTDVGLSEETHAKPTLVNSGKAEGEGKGNGIGREGEIERERDAGAPAGVTESLRAASEMNARHRRPTLEQAKSAAATIGVAPEKADEWWHAREANEWVKGTAGGGTTPVGTNWQADMKTYSSRGAQSPAGTPPPPTAKSKWDT